MSKRTSGFHRQNGVAIAIVMWFVAGMAILVAGIVMDARMDTRMAQVHLARAKAVAAGDGAIAMALVEARAKRARRDSPAPSHYRYRIGDVSVQVHLQPQAGLVDLNRASQALLTGLFLLKGGVEQASAAELADNVVKWRSAKRGERSYNSGTSGFRSPEDLLRVQGFSRTLLDAIRDYTVVSSTGGSGGAVSWTLAPQGLLDVAQLVNPESMTDIFERREQHTSQKSAGRGRSTSGKYRVDALVHYGDSVWRRRHWVTLGASGGAQRGSGLPWQVERVEPARIVSEHSARIEISGSADKS